MENSELGVDSDIELTRFGIGRGDWICPLPHFLEAPFGNFRRLLRSPPASIRCWNRRAAVGYQFSAMAAQFGPPQRFRVPASRGVGLGAGRLHDGAAQRRRSGAGQHGVDASPPVRAGGVPPAGMAEWREGRTDRSRSSGNHPHGSASLVSIPPVPWR